MNIQHSPRDLDQSLQELDNAIKSIDHGTKVLAPKTVEENHRTAIVSLVDNLATALTTQIGTLQTTLKRIEQQVLTSAERSRAALQDHVSVCERVSDEIKHMSEVVADLERDTRDA
jgi:gas vesicle protein